MSSGQTVNCHWLGLVDYDRAWEMQKQMVSQMHDGAGQDALLLLEHPAVYTLGRRAKEAHLLFDEGTLKSEGIAVRHVNRGGDITYHGPGQLVGYPILALKRLYGRRGYARPDLHLYLREIEETLIVALAHFGIQGRRYEGYTGVWVDGEDGPSKIAAIGIKVSSRGVSSHGFALNVNPNLRHFEGIIPCGIREHGVTSLAQLLGRSVTVEAVLETVVEAFSRVFGVRTRFVSLPQSA